MGYSIGKKNVGGVSGKDKVKTSITVSHQVTLMEWLRKPGMAAGYLGEALRDDDPRLFLLALRNVVDACGGIRKLAKKTKLNRENLYRMLSKKGNPGIYSIQSILSALNIQLAFVQKTKFKKAS